MKQTIPLVAAMVAAALACPAGMGQMRATAQLAGVVTDPSGAPVADQAVVLRPRDTGQTRTARTGPDGYYAAPGLAPGGYEVTVEARGFEPVRIVHLELETGEDARLDVALRMAPVKQEATVVDTAEASDSVSEPTRTGLSEVIEPRSIEQLPINGRQYLDFVLLTPNAHTGRTGLSNPATPGEPNQVNLSFGGLHESTSLVLVDGANDMNRVFGRARSTPSQEAVLEFRVLNDTFEAALGPAAAGVVSIVTRSGTNVPHGSVYEYFRNNAMDARNVLAPAGFDELRQNQFGTTYGGPVERNRFFLFGNYEGQRHRESPSYSSVLLNNLEAINRQLTAFGLAPETLAGKIRQLDYDQVFVRGDYQASGSNQVSATYRYRKDADRNLGAASNQLSAPSNFRDAAIGDHAGTVNWTWAISPSKVSQTTLQFAQRGFRFPSVSNEPHLSIANTLDLGRHFNAIDGYGEARFEVAEGFTWVKGAHTMRAGGDFSKTSDDFFYDPFDPAYAVFPNLNGFLGTAPFAGPFAVTFGFTEAPDGTRPAAPKGFLTPASLAAYAAFVHPKSGQAHSGLFAQDQWRVTPRVTLNYGLRWDLDRMPAQYFNAYYKALQPRAGVAWSVNSRVTVRAGAGAYQGTAYGVVYLIAMVAGQDSAFGIPQPGYGVYSNTLHSPFFSNPAQATQQLLSFLATGVYPALNPANFAPAQQFVSTIRKDNHGGPYSYQWNGQVETRLTRELTISMSYLGLRGLSLPSAWGGNVAPTNLTLGNGMADYAISPGSTVTRTLDPLISPLSLFFDATGQSTYHAATVSVNQRWGGHYAVAANYTWSKTIDNTADPSLNGFPQDAYRRYLERANSKQDVPQRLVARALADGPSRGLLRDFHVAVIGTVQSPLYFTIYSGSDVNHDGNANTDRPGLLGRSTYRGDRLLDVDARVSRTFRVRERVRAEAIVEAFNLFNSLNVTDINTVYGSGNITGAVPRHYGDGAVAPLAGFGGIRATDPPRQIQFALKVRF